MTNPTTSHQATPTFTGARMRPMASKTSCCSDCQQPTPPPIKDQPSGTTRYSWFVDGMDCAACARKVENAVSNVAGVEHAQVAFSTEKLIVDCSRDVRSDIESAIAKVGYRIRSENSLENQAPAWQGYIPIALLALMMAVSWALSFQGHSLGKIAFIATTLVGLYPVSRQAWRQIRSGTWFGIETLMTVAAVGALVIDASAEAAMVLLLFLIGERLEGWAANRARSGVTALMALKPEVATRLRGGQREEVALADLAPGDIIEVGAGGRLPADGLLLTPHASFDESALTGESVPVEHQQGDKIAAGCTSIDKLAQLEVVSRPGDSAVDRIIRLIEEAEERRAPIARFIDSFSRVYTPIIMLIALVVAVLPPLAFGQDWSEWVYKALTLLLIGCPCALVISTPAAITSGLAAAARHGALIKGGAALEQLGKVRQIALDKTGTLTLGQPKVTGVDCAPEIDENTLLRLAASVETGTHHPLGKALIREADQRQLVLAAPESQTTLAGVGIQARVEGRQVLICTPTQTPAGLLTPEWHGLIAQRESEGQTVVVVVSDNAVIGAIALQDTLRDDARAAMDELHALGIETIMLTGDNPRAAAAIANELGMEYRASLLPADKVAAVNQLNQQSPLAMVGDGINDAPAMKSASIGIAMGGGTDVALETADAALTHNRLLELPAMIRLARATHANIRQNITVALGLKAIFLVTTLLGVTGLWMAVLADTGATALVTANALRLLRKK